MATLQKMNVGGWSSSYFGRKSHGGKIMRGKLTRPARRSAGDTTTGRATGFKIRPR